MANIWKEKGFYMKGLQFLYITKHKDCQAGNKLGNLAQLKIEVSLELSIANPTGLIIGDRGSCSQFHGDMIQITSLLPLIFISLLRTISYFSPLVFINSMQI
jgi:hypothetical protein